MEYSSAAVTGSSGFIGSHLVHALKNKNVNVLEISRSANSIDVTDWELIEKMPAQDVVYHLAGITNIGEAFTNPRHVYFTNYAGALNILEWCRIHDIKKMVYVSTFVYGIPQYLPIDERHPLSPNNPYSQSKLLGEELCEAYCRDYSLNVVILRLFNIYGSGQKGNFLIPQVLSQLAGGEVVLRDPAPKRDFLYIDDVITALTAASLSDISGCNVFNIGSGRSYSVKEIADRLANLYFEQTGRCVSIKYMNDKRKSEISDTIANIEKAKNILRWTPKVDIDKGLSQTLRAYLDEYKK